MDFSLHEKEWSQYIVESADIFLGTSIANSMESSCAIFFYPWNRRQPSAWCGLEIIEIPLTHRMYLIVVCLAGNICCGINICFIRVLYETEKSLIYIFFTGFYFRVIMELSCTQETSDWPKEKLPEWSFCIAGAGTGLCVRLHHWKSFIARLPQIQAFAFLRNQTWL